MCTNLPTLLNGHILRAQKPMVHVGQKLTDQGQHINTAGQCRSRHTWGLLHTVRSAWSSVHASLVSTQIRRTPCRLTANTHEQMHFSPEIPWPAHHPGLACPASVYLPSRARVWRRHPPSLPRTHQPQLEPRVSSPVWSPSVWTAGQRLSWPHQLSWHHDSWHRPAGPCPGLPAPTRVQLVEILTQH